MTQPLVAVYGLGGTIAMTASDKGGVVPALSSEELLAAVPELTGVASIDAVSFRQVPGAHLGHRDVLELTSTLAGVAARGYAGAVVEALGGGHVGPAAANTLGQLARQMPVVLASRTGAGHVLEGT